MKYKKVLVALVLTCAFSVNSSQFMNTKASATEVQKASITKSAKDSSKASPKAAPATKATPANSPKMPTAILSDAPIQIHPAREDMSTPMNESTPKAKSGKPEKVEKGKATPTAAKTTKKAAPAKIKHKKKKKKIVKIPPNYENIEKLIEYNNFEDADRMLETAAKDFPKDIRAQALQVVSMAKQYKLDPAQKRLDTLLKTYPNNSTLHYAQGMVYYKRTSSSNMVYLANTPKLLNDAQREFKKAIELDKDNAQAYNAAGVVAIALGQQKEAKDYFKKAMDVDNKYSTATDNSGTIALSEGKLDVAEKLFNQALQYNSQNTTAMYHLAQVAAQKQDYSKALTYLNNAMAINPDSYAMYNLAGEMYAKQGNEAAAVNMFKKSVSIKPEFTLPYLNLADIYEKRGDSEFAIEQLKTALSIEPDNYDAKLKMADISLSAGKYSQAIENYSSLIGIKDYNDNALKGLANAYFEKSQIASYKGLNGSTGELFNAYDLINKAIAANSQDLELHLAKLKLAKVTNQPEASKTALQEIIKSPATDLTTYITKGEAYLALNNYQEAQKAFDQATKVVKTTQDGLYLSEIFIYHKQYENAKNLLKDIMQKEPQNQLAANSLDYIQKCENYAGNDFKSAEYFAKTGNYPAAMDYLSRSLANNPNNSKAHLLLAQLYERQKDYKSAVLNYKAYLNLEINPPDKKYIEKKIIRLENK